MGELVSGQFHAPTALPLGKRATGTHWIGGWMGPRVGLDEVEKRKKSCTAGNRTRAVQPEAILTLLLEQ
jgi:hypothetical protein